MPSELFTGQPFCDSSPTASCRIHCVGNKHFLIMAYRGTESPMDFEWQGHGPVDPSSPFHRYAMENKKREVAFLSTDLSSNRSGTHTQFESPNKHELPSFGAPNGRPFFFSNVPPAPQASPFRAPSFTTPRKPVDIDFSSGGENSSPVQADNDETPEAKPFEFTASPPKSKKRNSLWGMYGRFAPSPRITRPFNDNLERRIQKRRRRALDKQQLIRVRRDSEDTSDDEEPAPKRSPSKQHTAPLPPQSNLSSFFSFLSTNPDLPAILSRYLQVIFNFLLLSFFGYIIYSFYQTIRADVDRAADEAVSDILAEMSMCSKQYIENSCASDKRVPAIEQLCVNWETCMNRDPQAVKRARLSAQTFAQIFNSFVEPISLKTMLFSVMIMVVSIVGSNLTFAYLRRPHDNYHHPQQAFYQNHPSQQHMMGQMGYMAATPALSYAPQTPGTQQQQWQQMNESAWGENAKRIEWNRSPSKEMGARGRSRSPEKRAVS